MANRRVEVNETFAKRLTELLEERDMKQIDLARALHLDKSRISRYARGLVPPVSSLRAIASFFKVQTDYLLGLTDQRRFAETPTTFHEEKASQKRLQSLPLIRTTKGASSMHTIQLETLPILGQIRAGVPLFAEEHIVGQIEVPAQLKRRADFALEVSGDSMIGAGLSPGDFVFLATVERHPVAHGNIVAAMVDGEMTLKRYIKRDGRFWLHAENPAYVDIPVDDKVQIQGAYVGRYSEYEGVVEPPLEDMSEDELISKLAEMRGLDPDTLSDLIDVLSKKRPGPRGKGIQ